MTAAESPSTEMEAIVRNIWNIYCRFITEILSELWSLSKIICTILDNEIVELLSCSSERGSASGERSRRDAEKRDSSERIARQPQQQRHRENALHVSDVRFPSEGDVQCHVCGMRPLREQRFISLTMKRSLCEQCAEESGGDIFLVQALPGGEGALFISNDVILSEMESTLFAVLTILRELVSDGVARWNDGEDVARELTRIWNSNVINFTGSSQPSNHRHLSTNKDDSSVARFELSSPSRIGALISPVCEGLPSGVEGVRAEICEDEQLRPLFNNDQSALCPSDLTDSSDLDLCCLSVPCAETAAGQSEGTSEHSTYQEQTSAPITQSIEQREHSRFRTSIVEVSPVNVKEDGGSEIPVAHQSASVVVSTEGNEISDVGDGFSDSTPKLDAEMTRKYSDDSSQLLLSVGQLAKTFSKCNGDLPPDRFSSIGMDWSVIDANGEMLSGAEDDGAALATVLNEGGE